MQDVQHVLEGVEEPWRSSAAQHDFHEVLVIALPGSICSGEDSPIA